MEFPEFLLNEPYILSPYKLCVANFLLSYIEEKNHQESANSVVQNGLELSLLNHCYLGFKLMMSLDCDYHQLRNQLLGFDHGLKESISGKVIARFDTYLREIDQQGINKLHDFIRKLAKVMQRKLFHHSKPNLSNSSLTDSDSYRINRLSMAGFYLRKLIIHFERLAFSEVVILYHHLKKYLTLDSANNYSVPIDVSTIQTNNQKSETKVIESKLLEQFTDKLEKIGDRLPNDICEHLNSMIIEAKEIEVVEEVFEESKQPDQNNSSTMDLDESMDLDDTILTDKTTVGDQPGLISDKKNNRAPVARSGPFAGNYASQQFLTKQVHKILTNEKTALSPPQIVDFIGHYFEQHNLFYYNRFIKLNYLANLAMIKETNPLGSANGQTAPVSNSNSANAVGNNRRSKNLFQSINFYSDMHYLKFINALRVNNYTMAAEYFYTYFDLKKFGSSGLSSGSGLGSSSTSSYSYNSTMLGVGPMGNNGGPGGGNNGGQLNGGGNGAVAGGAGVGGPGGGVGGGGGGGGGPNAINTNPGINMASSVNSSVGSNGNWMAPLNSSSSNFCWSALNLAILYAHFRHYKLAYEALTDCISAAREKRDEQCLQFAMIWMLLVLQQFDHHGTTTPGSAGSSPGTMMSPSAGCLLRSRYHNSNSVYRELNLMENLVNLIVYNEHSLPYISAMATLHLEKLHYLRPIYPSVGSAQQQSLQSGQSPIATRFEGPRRPPLTCRPLVLSVQHQMDDILMRTFTLNAAILNAYGASHLAALVSNLLLRLELFDSIGDESISHFNENTAIAVRNVALYQWTIRGNYCAAVELVRKFSKYYSKYSTGVRAIIEQAMTEIKFERALYSADWDRATCCINLVRCVSRNQSLMMMAELRRRQNEPVSALECLDSIFSPNDRFCFNSTGFDSTGESSLLVQESGSGRSSLSSSQRLSAKPKLLSSLTGQKSTVSQQSPIPNGQSPGGAGGGSSSSTTHRLPSTLEPEEERALTSDLDPYMWLSCYLLKATILGDLSRLLDCVVKAQAHGFKQLECRALLEIARCQQNLLGGYVESQNIIDAIMVRLLANGALRDIARAYFLTATNHFYLHQNNGEQASSLIDPPLRSISTTTTTMTMNRKKPISQWNCLQTAAWANKRAMVIWIRIGDKSALLESLNLAALVEHCRKNRQQRNNFARKAKQIRAELLKH